MYFNVTYREGKYIIIIIIIDIKKQTGKNELVTRIDANVNEACISKVFLPSLDLLQYAGGHSSWVRDVVT